MANEQTEPKVTSAEFEEVAAFFLAETKRHDLLRRIASVTSRTGSIEAAVVEAEKRITALREQEAGVKRDIEITRRTFEKNNREAEAIIEAANQQAAAIVAKAKADAKAEVAKVQGELKTRREQLDQVSKRLVDAQKLLAG